MSSPHHLPRRVFPVPYQVDFTVENKGRNLDSTKRRITWKVGFAHPPAVFPHLHDADEKLIGEDADPLPYPTRPKTGVECRGREHEIILTWSVLTGKAHIYVDSREIIRHEPRESSILPALNSSFRRGFDLPDAEFNGRHRIQIQCYARTPIGAKDLVVDDRGGRFRQYDLTVDGLSFFVMPAMYELGTDIMWQKVSQWGLNMADSPPPEEENYRRGQNGGHAVNMDFAQRGRMEDEYYFDKAKRKGEKNMGRYGQTISDSEYKAMAPRSESQEEEMMRIAMEQSLNDHDQKQSYGKSGNDSYHSTSFEENNSASANRQRSGERRGKKTSNGGKGLTAIGEDENLIDFGVEEAVGAISQITISRERSSDVSVLGDDDATTASFMMPRPPPPAGLIGGAPQPYRDPTFHTQYAPQPWSGAGTMGAGVGGPAQLPMDASFAVPPPPTWDDYKDAFGGSVRNMGMSVAGGSVAMNAVSPVPSPMMQQPPKQFGAQQWTQTQAWGPSGGGVASRGPPMESPSAPAGKVSKFDPLRADPFAL